MTERPFLGGLLVHNGISCPLRLHTAPQPCRSDICDLCRPHSSWVLWPPILNIFFVFPLVTDLDIRRWGPLFLLSRLAIAVLWMFHSFVKLPAAALLPDRMQTRLGPHLNHFQFGGVGHFALIVGSTLVGIMTHLFWDSFTHRNTWAYHRWAALRGSIDVGIAGPMPLYKLLQHGSTILGTAILIIWILQWYGSTSPNTSGFRAKLTHNERLVAAIMVIIIVSVAGVIRALVANRMLGGEVAFRGFVGYFVVTAISLVWWQFVVYGVFNSKAIRRPRI